MFTVFLKNLLQLVLSPSHGWEDISNYDADAKGALSFMLWLFAIASISVFARYIYGFSTPFLQLFEEGMIVFVTLFVAYFLAVALLPLILPTLVDSGRVNMTKIKTVVCYILSLMAIVLTLDHFLPSHLGVIYLIIMSFSIIIWKSNRYMDIKPEHEIRYVTLASMVILLPTIILLLLLSALL